MIEPHVHLAYAPRGAGLLYAVMWFTDGADVYGWFIGERDGEYLASYFILQDYHSRQSTRCFRSLEDDVNGGWLECRWGREQPVDHSPVPEPMRHEMARLQDEFIRHWLFFRDDPTQHDEARALNARELSVRHVNIRASRLNKLKTGAAVWTYDSAGADVNVLVHLSRHWPLEHRMAA